MRADSRLLVIFSLRFMICVDMGKILIDKNAFYSKIKAVQGLEEIREGELSIGMLRGTEKRR